MQRYGYSGSLQISGLADIQQRLAAFGEDIAGKATAEALIKAARVIQKEAIHLVRTKCKNRKRHKLKISGVYEWLEPGNLSRNIKIKVPSGVKNFSGGDSIKYMNAVGISGLLDRVKGRKEVQVYVKLKRAWYAKFVEGQENGTSRQAPQPFMRPAYESKKDEALMIFAQEINQAITSGRF